MLAPANGMAQMNQIIMNDRIDATLCAIFMMVVVTTAAFGVAAILKAVRSPVRTAREFGMEGFGHAA